MGITSSIKPDDSSKQTIDKKLEYNDRSYQSYIDNGFEKAIPYQISAQHDREIEFLTAASLEKAPIQREVWLIKRIRNQDGKEYLIYHENWYARNFLGRKLILRDHIEGFHIEQTKEPKYDIENHLTGWEQGTEEKVYSIPFSKAAVDKIIAGQIMDKDFIKYLIDTAPSPQNDYANYEQFTTLSWTDCLKILMKPAGFKGEYLKSLDKEDEPKKEIKK